MSRTTLARLKSLRAGCPIALVMTGLILISIGIGMIYLPAGVIAGGLSAIVLEWRISE